MMFKAKSGNKEGAGWDKEGFSQPNSVKEQKWAARGARPAWRRKVTDSLPNQERGESDKPS